MRTNDHVHVQSLLPFTDARARLCVPFKTQLLKWVGNKQRFAHEIVSYFPRSFGTYYEPFVGSGAVLATLAPQRAVASDAFSPLMEIWRELKRDPDELASWYAERWNRTKREPNDAVYQRVKSSFNQRPNGADLLYLCRACYGGIVRFRKADGYMSTPCGVHQPIDPASFKKRTVEWHKRCRKADFCCCDFRETMQRAKAGDLVYCDPPYVDSQAILYGAQSFGIATLFEEIARCKSRGVHVAMSIDGTKRSGSKTCDVPIPDELFVAHAAVNCGRSMLRRFQMAGKTLESEVVADRLLLTYSPFDD